ncbi:MAG: restriction endonuclease subunit S [Balneolaceae bacterium]|nr:restriction endonuclease subunit S [Balneolaceae bacterium]
MEVVTENSTTNAVPTAYKRTELGVMSRDWQVLYLNEIAEIIDGDRGKHYPSSEELRDNGYCLFLNAKNVTKDGFKFSECEFISVEKDNALSKGKLTRGDIVLTTRGTLGNAAFYNSDIQYSNIRINSGMIIIRVNNLDSS